MSRTIAGTFLLPDGSPLANAKIYLEAKRTEALSILDGVSTFFSTSSSGIYSQSVVNGFYSVSVEVQIDVSSNGYRRWPLGDIYVEDGASTTLQALLLATTPPDDIALTVFYDILTQTQEARDDAQTAATSAAASAASITPTASPTDTTPGRLWRTNDLVKTTSAVDNASGRVTRVGDGGLLAACPSVAPDASGISGFYQTTGVSSDSNFATTGMCFIQAARSGSGANGWQFGSVPGGSAGNNAARFYGRRTSGTAGDWGASVEFWTSYSIPNPATTDTSQTITGAKTFSSKITASAGVSLPSYTVSTVPSASANTNIGIIVTNPSSGGRRPYWSDGTNWYDAAHTLLA